MNKAQKIVVVLLVIAIVFSVFTVVLTLSFGNFTSIKSADPKANIKYVGEGSGSQGGQVTLINLPPKVEE